MAADRYLFEAFQALDGLNEDVFDVTPEGATKLQDFISDDNAETDMEDIIDPLAQSDEDLKDSYIGKVILDCTVCQSKIYKDPSEVIISEEDETLANVGEACPYCQDSSGYKIIGEVAPYTKTDVDVEVTPKEDGSEEAKVDVTSDDDLTEGCKDKDACKEEDCKKEMKEDLNSITVDTDKETINVTTTEKAEDGAEMIAPVSDEVKTDIEDNSVEETEPSDVDLDEFDETSFDGLGESYLKKVYENVNSYKTTKAYTTKDNAIMVEGLIGFKSGKQAKTTFKFEAKETNGKKLKFFGENKQFAKGRKPFTLVGKADGSKLVCESLTYNYIAKDPTSNKSKRLYGRVSK